MSESTKAEWRVELLSASHECGFLSSGRPDIDEWFASQAERLQGDRTCVTYVWADQPPYALGFFTLTPHRVMDVAEGLSGHAGGAMSGYLIAKIGINQNAVSETVNIWTGPAEDDFAAVSPTVALLIDAVVHASRAAYYGGGRWLFIDSSNEPQHILDNLDRLGFKSITAEGSPMRFLKLGRPES